MSKRQCSPGAFTVSAELVHGILECAARCGLDVTRFSDLLPPEPGGASARYAGDFLMRLWSRLARVSDDPIMGFRMALHATPATFGVLAQILPRCATVHDVFLQAQRYSALASSGSRLTVELDETLLTVVLVADGFTGDVERAIVLWLLTNLSLMPRRFTGQRVRPVAIECALAEPPSSALRELRTHALYVFSSERNAVVFPRAVSELPVPTADVDLKRLLNELMDQRLASVAGAPTFKDAIAQVLSEMFDGTMPSLASLSVRVGLPQRTLQRRLAAAGTSFEKLLQQALRDRADHLLIHRSMSQGEVAFLLGYSEVSAFSRAYRKWTGVPPGQAGKQNAPADERGRLDAFGSARRNDSA